MFIRCFYYTIAGKLEDFSLEFNIISVASWTPLRLKTSFLEMFKSSFYNFLILHFIRFKF